MAPEEALRYIMMMTSVFFSRCFPQRPPVNLNMYQLTIYNHMDAVIMCCDRDPDPLNIPESDKVMFFALNYIITLNCISNLVTV